jgi:dihydropyrimidinase
MASFDLTVRNGTLVTANESSRGDLGIAGERIVAVAEKLPAGTAT